MLPLAITLGCPGGVGPEIILKYFSSTTDDDQPPAVVAGDTGVLSFYADKLGIACKLVPWQPGSKIPDSPDSIAIFETSSLPPESIKPGSYSTETSAAMASAITNTVNGVLKGHFSGIVTCPISKEALQLSKHHYPGHTEMLATLTGSDTEVMMMSGNKLKVTLATIHCPLNEVSGLLNIESLVQLFQTTYDSLCIDFNLTNPRLAVAALNPHAGEGGMFGKEEQSIIVPAIKKAAVMDIPLHGPFPPDTVFYKAAHGEYDAVICMYHDQGLIPFKLLHFEDGVNVTLGLPLVRTSVDHGTAYDIAGLGVADPSSLRAAIHLAHTICAIRDKRNK